MTSRFCAVLPSILILSATSASAYTPAEIDAAGLVAQQIGIVNVIASDFYGGRNNDTPDSTAVQSLLVDELKLLGSGLNTAQTGDDAYKQVFVSTANGTNLLAVITGSTLPNEYVMIGAHYDHFGTIGSDIFNGATDDAAGVAIVLAVGAAINALPSPPQRSVILALWDAEEDGLVGSEYFSNNPLVSLATIKGYINLDIQGANLLPSLRGITTLIAAESGGSILQALVTNATQSTPLDYRAFSRLFGQDRSDHASFIDDGVPVVFLSDGTGSCYHTPDDDPQVVDLGKLAAESEVAFRLVVELTEVSVPPSYTATGLLDTVYQDAVEVLDLIDLSLVDLSLFPSATQTQIVNQRATVEGIVNAGPGSFTFNNGLTVGIAASTLLTAVENLPCNGFLPGIQAPTSTAPIRVGLILILVAIGTLFAKRRGAIA